MGVGLDSFASLLFLHPTSYSLQYWYIYTHIYIYIYTFTFTYTYTYTFTFKCSLLGPRLLARSTWSRSISVVSKEGRKEGSRRSFWHFLLTKLFLELTVCCYDHCMVHFVCCMLYVVCCMLYVVWPSLSPWSWSWQCMREFEFEFESECDTYYVRVGSLLLACLLTTRVHCNCLYRMVSDYSLLSQGSIYCIHHLESNQIVLCDMCDMCTILSLLRNIL